MKPGDIVYFSGEITNDYCIRTIGIVISDKEIYWASRSREPYIRVQSMDSIKKIENL